MRVESASDVATYSMAIPFAFTFILLAYVLGFLYAADLYLDPWWFQNDACPNDPELFCGKTPPVFFLGAAPIGFVAATLWTVGVVKDRRE